MVQLRRSAPWLPRRRVLAECCTDGWVCTIGECRAWRGGAMYGRHSRRHIPDVEDHDLGRPGAIASREPLATSTRDYMGTADPNDQRERLLDDMRERVGDFGEWRADYSRQLAR